MLWCFVVIGCYCSLISFIFVFLKPAFLTFLMFGISTDLGGFFLFLYLRIYIDPRSYLGPVTLCIWVYTGGKTHTLASESLASECMHN